MKKLLRGHQNGFFPVGLELKCCHTKDYIFLVILVNLRAHRCEKMTLAHEGERQEDVLHMSLCIIPAIARFLTAFTSVLGIAKF